MRLHMCLLSDRYVAAPLEPRFQPLTSKELSQTTVEGRDDRALTKVVLRCVQSGLLSPFAPRIQRKR